MELALRFRHGKPSSPKNYSLPELGLFAAAKRISPAAWAPIPEIERTGEVVQLVRCNFDRRCVNLPTPGTSDTRAGAARYYDSTLGSPADIPFYLDRLPQGHAARCSELDAARTFRIPWRSVLCSCMGSIAQAMIEIGRSRSCRRAGAPPGTSGPSVDDITRLRLGSRSRLHHRALSRPVQNLATDDGGRRSVETVRRAPRDRRPVRPECVQPQRGP